MTHRSGTTEKTSKSVLLALALLPAVLYANTLANSFQYDDFSLILNNLYVHSLSGIGHFFVSPQLISNVPLSGYRPLTMATFVLNYAVGGESTMGYHLVNVAIHIVNTLLVYAVSLVLMRTFEIGRSRNAALVVALLFASHPINTQPVNYISGRSTLLVGCFSLLCFLLYARSREKAGTTAGNIALAGSLAAYLCALLSKEEAVAAFGLLAAYELCRFRLQIDGKRLREIFFGLLPFMIMTAGFLVFVVRILGIVGDTAQARGVWENLLTQARVFFIYMRMIAFPTNLSIDHVVATSTSLFEPAALASAIGVIAVLVGSVFLVRSVPAVPFGIWWMMIVLTPSSTLIALKLVLNEQRLYLAAAGIMFIAGAGFAKAVGLAHAKGQDGVRRALVCGFAVVLAVSAALTVRRNAQWRDPMSLWGSALEKYPDSARANTQVAVNYLKINMLEEALAAAKKAVEAAPEVVEVRVVLSTAYSRAGLAEDALAHARAAVDLNPASTAAQTAMGVAYAKLGRLGEAEAAWQRAVEIDPQTVEARENLENLKAKRKPEGKSME